ncbi:MAG TPA: HAMP domain-containing sensor histidine kinase [Rubrivivax sp.]|nr:HAMP domain-containing sensor histidine kinase [Rubrivivax sp.]
MLNRLPYRIQIPLGLSVAVVIAALLVTAVAARISARTARQDTLATVDRAIVLLAAQSRPLLTADDTWRVFALLRNTAALIPGAEAGRARAAVLDSEGRVFAASDPTRLETGRALLGDKIAGLPLPGPAAVSGRLLMDRPDEGVSLLEPIRSEDGQVQGFIFVDIDAGVFAPDWAALMQPALVGALLAVIVLVPAGWWIGRRMTRPVASVARFIERIGNEDPAVLHAELPRTADPELGRIAGAVDRLIGEMQVRQQAEQRALSSERMAAVGRLTAAVAHEINNPLGGLLNAAQTMRLHGATESTRLQTLTLIERGLQQIRSTVAALVPQARIEDRPLELNDLADVVTLVLPVATRRSIDLRSHADVSVPLRVPSAMLRQVMLNLLSNAVKAAGDQGWVNACLEADDEVVRFVVSNGGERLDAQALESRITAESGNDPRGFGLWVCRELAIQFGGGFGVVDTDNTTTTLQFWIPNRERDETAAVD